MQCFIELRATSCSAYGGDMQVGTRRALSPYTGRSFIRWVGGRRILNELWVKPKMLVPRQQRGNFMRRVSTSLCYADVRLPKLPRGLTLQYLQEHRTPSNINVRCELMST
jgi:hypothetical protein